jgi:Zn-dependent protease
MSDQVMLRSPPIRLRVRTEFLVAVLLAGALVSVRDGWARMLLWAGTILGSLLFQELARCLAGCAGGYRGLIVLTAFGPNTRFEPEPPLGPFVLLRFVGPITSLAIWFALTYASHLLPHPTPNWLTLGTSFNLAWTGINSLPIGPFDGGRVLERMLGKDRSSVALLISMMVAEMAATMTFVVFRSPEVSVLLLATGIASASSAEFVGKEVGLG